MVDVIIDGVSLVLTYRAQFEKLMQSASSDTLLQRIERKVAEGSF